MRNVLIICLDTVREDTFWLPETKGYVDSFSPWARRAIRFRNVQSPSSWTVPAISSLFTSLYPVQHGAGQFPGAVANLDVQVPNILPESVQTLAEMLRAKNYRTIGYVSNPFIGPETGVMQGFLTTRMLDTTLIPAPANEWLRRYARDKTPAPFFLYVHLMDAHGDHWLGPERLAEIAARLPAALQNDVGRDAAGDICSEQESEWCLRYKTYTQTVLDSRKIVADFLSTLESSGLLSSTIVVVFSDHGEEFRDHAAEEIRRASDPRNMAGAGHGHAMWQEILEIPMLIWHPNRPGQDIETPASLIDVLPTLAQWLDLSKNDTWRGESLADLDALTGKRRLRERALYASGIAYGPDQAAVRRSEWKSVRHYCPPEDELFHLPSDPFERRPLDASRTQHRMSDLLANYEKLPSFAVEQQTDLSPEQIEQLRSLGYLQGRSGGAERLSRCEAP